MISENDSLKIGRLEDKFNLYEPILISLQGVASVPAEITKMQDNLQELRDSSVAVREQLVTLFKAQDRAYTEMVKSLEEQARLMEKEIANCPIDDVKSKLVVVEKDMIVVKAYGGRLKTAEDAIDSFKLKGWDLIFKIAPWVVAFASFIYAAIKT